MELIAALNRGSSTDQAYPERVPLDRRNACHVFCALHHSLVDWRAGNQLWRSFTASSNCRRQCQKVANRNTSGFSTFYLHLFTPLCVAKTDSTEKKKTPQFLSSNHTIPTLCFRRTPQRSRTRRYLHRFSSALQQRVAR